VTTATGSRLARNTAYNLLGLLVPVAAAVVSVPVLLGELGRERFGVLALAYVLVGYLGLFDAGLGRALTQLLARRRGSAEPGDAGPLVWTYLWTVTGAGVVAGAVLALTAPWLAREGLALSPSLEDEVVGSLRLLALALPLSLSTPGLRGCLEAYERFDLVALVRVPSGIGLTVGPLAVLPFTTDLVWLMAVIVGVRLLTWLVHLEQCRRVVPSLSRPRRPRADQLRPLLAFAGWITVSNLVAPLMAYLDRFVIGGAVSVAAVAVYATPYDVVTKLTILPLALTGVLFPAFATSSAGRPEDAAPLYLDSLRWTLYVMAAPVAVVVALAHPALALWLGEAFADDASTVLQVLAVGVFLNGVAQVPSGLLQGIGRPRDTTMLLLAELPLYLVALFVAVPRGGVVAAAVIWSARVAVDALLLLVLANHRLGVGWRSPELFAILGWTATTVVGLVVLALVPSSLVVVVPLLVVLTTAFLVLGWRTLLTTRDRTALERWRRRRT
jgi:O-antigen/teichoic acid export membrane protein